MVDDVLKYSGPKQDHKNRSGWSMVYHSQVLSSLGRQKYQNTESKRETANQNPFWIQNLRTHEFRSRI